MFRSRINGVFLAPLLCAVYVGVAIVLLRRLGTAAGMLDGAKGDIQIQPLGYYIAAIIGIFGGLIFVGIIYRMDGTLWKAAPEWLYLILALAVPYTIYWFIPP